MFGNFRYKLAEPTLLSGLYHIYKKFGTASYNLKVYCDMENDGGGWTLVMHDTTTKGKIQAISGFQWPGSSEQVDDYNRGDRQLDPTGHAFKFSDIVINEIRTHKNQGTIIGYRTTTNSFDDVAYFHHEDCDYAHRPSMPTSKFHPCRRYTTKLDAAQKDWVQCTQRVDSRGTNDGGIDCAYGCGKETTWTQVVSTFEGGSNGMASLITDNTKGTKEDPGRYGTDLLLWVR